MPGQEHDMRFRSGPLHAGKQFNYNVVNIICGILENSSSDADPMQ